MLSSRKSPRVKTLSRKFGSPKSALSVDIVMAEGVVKQFEGSDAEIDIDSEEVNSTANPNQTFLQK